jgi:hypothetical protein
MARLSPSEQSNSMSPGSAVAPFFKNQLVGRPYQICNDISERMCCRSFWCDLAAVDQVLDMALIAAQLKQPTGSHPIETTIPSPQAAALVFEEQQHHHGAAD